MMQAFRACRCVHAYIRPTSSFVVRAQHDFSSQVLITLAEDGGGVMKSGTDSGHRRLRAASSPRKANADISRDVARPGDRKLASTTSVSQGFRRPWTMQGPPGVGRKPRPLLDRDCVWISAECFSCCVFLLLLLVSTSKACIPISPTPLPPCTAASNV